MATAGKGVIRESGLGGIHDSDGKGAVFFEVDGDPYCPTCCATCTVGSETCSYCTDLPSASQQPQDYTATPKGITLCSGCLDPNNPGSDQYDYKLFWAAGDVLNNIAHTLTESAGGCRWTKTLSNALGVIEYLVCDGGGGCDDGRVLDVGCAGGADPNTYDERAFTMDIIIRIIRTSLTEAIVQITAEKASELTWVLFTDCVTITSGVCAAIPDASTKLTSCAEDVGAITPAECDIGGYTSNEAGGATGGTVEDIACL